MAGILDPKQRIMDAILTEIGRLQMVKGEFDVKFVSFSDAGVDYADNGSGVLEPISDRLFFEPFSNSSDEIIPEIDSLGKFIIDQALPGTLKVTNGVLSEQQPSGAYKVVDGYSKVTTFTQNTKDRFNSLGILNTKSDVAEFEVSPTSFTLKAQTSTDSVDPQDINADGILPLSIDPRFENQLNMKYLPPMVEKDGNLVPFKSFNKWTSTIPEDSQSEKLKHKLEEIKNAMPPVDNITEDPPASTRFTIGPSNSEDYKDYNILGQIFVSKLQSIKKYTLIDAGEYFDADNFPICRIYFAGFVLKDSYGTTKFQREFSLIFHNGKVTQSGDLHE